MPTSTGAAPREISYAFSARSRVGKAAIRGVENATGRLRLLKMALGYETEVEAGRDFWEVMQERYRIALDLVGGGLKDIPAEGPPVMVANHPYGILDGPAMGRLLSAARGGDFEITANVAFKKARDLDRVILPIDFAGTEDAVRHNIEARRQALEYLGQGARSGFPPAARSRLRHIPSGGRWTRPGGPSPPR